MSKDEKKSTDEMDTLPKSPACPKCKSMNFTFTEIYGPRERVREIETLVETLDEQGKGKERELERWYAQKQISIAESHKKKLAELQPDNEESAFLLLSDDKELQTRLESIERERASAEAKLQQQHTILRTKIAEERDAALFHHIGPENILRAVYCEKCGELISVVEPGTKSTNPSAIEERLEKLESAIQSMHQDLLQCLKTLTARLTMSAKTSSERK